MTDKQVLVPEAPDPGLGIDERQLRAMQNRLRELTFLHEIGRVVGATLDLEGVLQALLAQVQDYFQVEAASVALWHEETGELVFRAAVGKVAEKVVGLRLAPGQGVAGWVVETGRPALVPEARVDGRFDPGVDEQTGLRTREILAVPLKIEGRSAGVIEVLNPAAGVFDGDAQQLPIRLAPQFVTSSYTSA
jgi:GAF domain-containing protein